MELIFATNLAVAALLLAWPYWFSRHVLHLPPLNPLTIVMLVNLPIELMKLIGGPLILIDGGLYNAGFQYAVLMSSVLTVSQIASTCFFFKCAAAVRLERYLPFRSMQLKNRHLRRALAFFLFIFAGAFVLLATAHIGLVQWMANPRTGYQLYRTGQGHWFALALNALAVAAMLAFLIKPRSSQILLKALLFLSIGYFLGSKAVLLSMFVACLVMLWFSGWRHLFKSIVLGGPLVFALLAWNLYLALSDAFELQSLVEYFDYYKNAADYYAAVLSGNVKLFYGEIMSSSLWAYVPRALVPEKPYVYGVILVNEIFYPGQAELTNTPAFGGAVAQYADFGVAGVLIFGFFNGQVILNALLYYLAFRRPGIDLNRITLGQFLVLLALFGPMFGLYFPGLLYWMLLAAVALAVFISRARYGKTERAGAVAA